ncbi:hypothetical protein GUITHDRAFT_160672 [Guillardia theta CCMP2712]|uniref:Chloride channel protein n=1 Tax=Guillardia theta (strain CCMP2712) TaxID=905079 RepID=L1K1L2_GUITC|nr:hypothetical protein GUITHDRAFT_160672 [Guillardia theta CCMP2712]EKX54454.1 hypothetical protein GUITHDRAFT_160672 [Guillardia theta CCMP2712]|eukprot:XP_005841434.1 hypothetical protein GUITHDRAFT_160672 [Guillardia theta CCMP2712]
MSIPGLVSVKRCRLPWIPTAATLLSLLHVVHPLTLPLSLSPTPRLSGHALLLKSTRSMANRGMSRLRMTITQPRKDEPNNFQEIGLIGAAAVVGAGSGLAVVAFKEGIKAMRGWTYQGSYAQLVHNIGSFLPSSGLPNMEGINLEYICFPVMGGLLTSLFLLVLRKDFGPGLTGQLEEVDRGVPIDPVRFLARQVSAVAALGSGCSLGPEGPSVEIGLTVSRAVSSTLGLDASLRRILASAGAAAGVAAGFNAPLTGVVFALEIVQPTISKQEEGLPDAKLTTAQRAAAGTVLTSAAIACLVARSGIMVSERFMVKEYFIVDKFAELPVYMTLGILTGVVAASFRFLVNQFRKFYAGEVPGLEGMARVPRELKPLIAASLCGVVATKYPQVLFFGYETVNSLLAESATYVDDTETLLTLMVLKVTLTASCVASGLMGGIFAPSLFFGATLGAAYDNVMRGDLGLDIASTTSYAMVGAAAVLASVFRAPVTGILLLFELTRNYDIVMEETASVAHELTSPRSIESSHPQPTWAWWWQNSNPENNGSTSAAEDPDILWSALKAGADEDDNISLRKLLSSLETLRETGSIDKHTLVEMIRKLGFDEEHESIQSLGGGPGELVDEDEIEDNQVERK